MNDVTPPQQPNQPTQPTQPIQPTSPSDPSSEQPEATRVLPPDTPDTPGTPRPSVRERLVNRAWSLPALIAVALVSVIIGGLGGAAVANIGDEDERGGPGEFHRMGQMDPPGHLHWERGGPRGDQDDRHFGGPDRRGPEAPEPSPPTQTG